VVFYRCPAAAASDDHDGRTKARVAEAIARLLGCDYEGEIEGADSLPRDRKSYVVPSHTLADTATLRELAIRGPADFYGGAVPHPFVGTKAISHPLPNPGVCAPRGWSHDLGALIDGTVLPGFSAFCADDVRAAGAKLLAAGGVRVKQVNGVGGSGQTVVQDLDALHDHVDALDAEGLVADGVVVERNLRDVRTLSIGQIDVGGRLAAYVGTQQQTINGRGHEVYGGSRLRVVRGGFRALLSIDLDAATRTAVGQALHYHASVLRCYPAVLISRCNYDVAQGADDEGRWHSGVLEQSWRIGGASGAEIAALRALCRDPERVMVCASTREVYGEAAAVPPGAEVLFVGCDRHGDRLTKYVEVEADGHV
jgi:hypothetical protein